MVGGLLKIGIYFISNKKISHQLDKIVCSKKVICETSYTGDSRRLLYRTLRSRKAKRVSRFWCHVKKIKSVRNVR